MQLGFSQVSSQPDFHPHQLALAREGVAAGLSQVCPRLALSFPQYASGLLKDAQDLSKVCLRFAAVLPQACPEFAPGLSHSCSKLAPGLLLSQIQFACPVVFDRASRGLDHVSP